MRSTRRLCRGLALGMTVVLATGAGLGPDAQRAEASDLAGPSSETAVAVAKGFGLALWSFSWSEPSTEQMAKLHRWVTAGLWTQISNSPGAPAADQAERDRHQIDRVTSVVVVVANRSRAGVGLAISAVVTVTAHGRKVAVGRDDAEILVLRTRYGWRVAEIDI